METQKTEQLQTKNITPRSTNYPAYPLDYAVEVIGKARKFGKAISDFHLSDGGSTNSGPFRRKKAALGYYGLLSGRGQTFQITDLAERILNPLNAEERETALAEAFLKPSLFHNLYSTVEKNTSISLSMIGNILIRQYGIQPSTKDEALSIFIKSGKFSGLISDTGENADEIIFHEGQKKESQNNELVQTDITQAEIIDNGQNFKVDYQTVELSLSKGKARIVVPNELSLGDIRKLKAQIDVLATDYDDDAGSH